jgi:hypothetical protein
MRRWTLALAFSALAVCASCGDDDDENEVEVSSPFQESVAAAADNLARLPSYSYETTLAVELPGAGDELGAEEASSEATGEAIPPASLHQVATSTLAFVSVTEELLLLPEGTFVLRDGTFIEGTGELQTIRLSVPSLWTQVATVAVLLPEDPGSESDTVGGRDTRHYVLEEIRLIFVKDLVLNLFGAVESVEVLPQRYTMELWFDVETDVLLQMAIDFQGLDAEERPLNFHLESTVDGIGEEYDISLE